MYTIILGHSAMSTATNFGDILDCSAICIFGGQVNKKGDGEEGESLCVVPSSPW